MSVSNTSCFSISNTVSYVHSSLPFLTGLSEEATRRNLSTVAALSASPGYLGSLFDLYLRSLSWGFLIVLLFVIIILITSLHFVCVYFCCFKKTDRDEQLVAGGVHSTLRWSCGIFTIICGMCAVAMLGVAFWLEVTLNKALLSNAQNSSIITETIRHWIVLSVLMIASFVIILTIVGFVVLILCKLSKCFTVCLITLSLITSIVAPVTGVGLSLLSFTSEFCEEFSEFSNCSSPITVAWSDICNGAFKDAFILTVLGCGLVFCISLGQCSGSVFSQLFISHLKRSTRIDDLSDNLDQPEEILMPVSTARQHSEPTAPPPMASTSPFIVGADRYLTGEEDHNSNIPRRRQTMPAYSGPSAEPPPVYDDLWLSQSVQLTGTHTPPASGGVSTDNYPTADQNQTEENTAL